jgi:hypothetical protein
MGGIFKTAAGVALGIVVGVGLVTAAAVAVPAAAQASTQLGCTTVSPQFPGPAAIFDRKPRSCDLSWGYSHADSIQLQRITWRTWAGREAAGRAVFRVKIYEPWTRVRVLAFRRRACGPVGKDPDVRLYTRVRVTVTSAPGGFTPWFIRRTWRAVPCSALTG